MDVRLLVEELGGVARAGELRAALGWRAIDDALARGLIVRTSYGTYMTSHAARAPAVAREFRGTLAGPSAAQHHGWQLLRKPDRPWVAVPRNRNLRETPRARLVRKATTGAVTPPVETVLDCARWLPFPEALAVADSALRAGLPADLAAAAARARGPGSVRVRRVAAAATGLAGSPLESALRAIALEVPGLRVRPQVPVELPGFTVHPDLVDEELRLAVEADTWAHHGATPVAFNRDMERYTLLVSLGWTVLRFGWQDVVERPAYVREVLERTVRLLREALLRARV